MRTMMALRAHVRGGPEQLVYEQAPEPTTLPGEALVAVHAAAITFAELTWDLSWTTRDGADRTPVIPSHEMSGVIAGLGDGVTNLAVGDEVIGLIDFDRDGAAAEYAAVPAATLAGKPPSLSHEQAATLPLAALTAWQALADYAALEPGERVLVLGGAGGVGLFAVQLAAILGGRVTATGRAADADLVRELGAERFISIDAADTAETSGGLDVVIDTVGGAALASSYALLREGGRLVTLSAPPDPERAAKLRIHAMFFVVAQDPDGLTNLAQMTDAGQLRPVLSQAFPLAEGRRAFQSGGHPHPPGKTILLVRE
jgi:NADPH:quinone reductase-like Zn-dependent oxidoreductase